MKIESLDDFFNMYTYYERLGKEYYIKALETNNPDLMSTVHAEYTSFPNFSRDEITPVRLYRHERYVKCDYHYHEGMIEMMYIFRGSCLHNLEEKIGIIGSGDIYLLSPGTFHSPEIYDDSVLINILLFPEYVKRLCDTLNSYSGNLKEYFNAVMYEKNYPKYIYCNIGDDEEIHALLRRIILEYYENCDYGDVIVESLLAAVFSLIMRRHNDECMICRDPYIMPSPAVPIMRYINDNYSDVCLKSVAEKFSYSEQHICRIIKSHTGHTFNEYLTNVRLSKAKILLLTTNLKISDIAHRCGYDGEAYFWRLFKKIEGTTPFAYRNKKIRDARH